MEELFINGRFLVRSISGVERFAVEIIKALISKNAPIKIVAPKKAKHQTQIPNEYVTYTGNFSGYWWEQVSLPLFLKKYNNPLLLNLANTAPLYYSNKMVTIHDLAYYDHPEWFSKSFTILYKLLIPRILKTARFVFTVSEISKQGIREVYGVSANNIAVIYNGLPEVFLNTEPKSNLFDFEYILTVGSLQPRKNIERLIKAYQQLKNPVFKLVIVGKANKVFRSIIDENLVHNSDIIFLDRVNDKELASLYKYCSKFIYPSLYEGFGLPVLEALYYNCDVLVSDIPVFKELFSDCVTFFNPYDINEISFKLAADNPKKEQIHVHKMIKNYNFGNAATIIQDNIERIESSIRP